MRLLWTYLGLLAALCLCGAAVTMTPPPRAVAAHDCACPACPGGNRCCCLPAHAPEAAAMQSACGPAAPVAATVQAASVLPASPAAPLALAPAPGLRRMENVPVPPGRLTPPPAQPPWSA